MKKRNTTKSI